MIDALPYAVSFAFGAVIASFLNVVIWRVPRGESIVSPPSHCPECGSRIRWMHNIPVLSWLILRGRCAYCGGRISPRYFLVELLGGALFAAAFWRYGIFAPLAWVWISLMIAGSFIDFDHKLLPDFTTVGGMIYGVAVAVSFWAAGRFGGLALPPPGGEAFFISPLMSLAGAATGFGALWLVRFLGSLAFRREAMGMGDVFLLGAVGAVQGPVAAVAAIAVSSIAGSVVGLSAIALSKTRLGSFAEIPYGPYICFGSLVWMFSGPQLVSWYLGFTGLGQ